MTLGGANQLDAKLEVSLMNLVANSQLGDCCIKNVRHTLPDTACLPHRLDYVQLLE